MAQKSSYLSESPLTNFIPPFVLGLIIYALNSWLFKVLVDFVHPAFQDFNPNWIISSACVITLIIGLKITFCKLRSNRKPTLLSIWYCLIAICLYFFIFRPNPYAFYFRCFGWSQIYISDLLLLSGLLYTVSYIYIDKPLVTNPAQALVEDLPHTLSKQNDPLTRYSYAGYIASVIKATVPEKALAISVLSDWGYGKTSFLNSVKEHLTNIDDPKNEANVILDFNPWKFEKSGQLLNHFFDELEIIFKPFDDRVAADLRDYADKLTESEDPSFIKLGTQSIARLFGNSKSLSERYNALNEAILRSGKRLIIIIDDLDRLMPEELVTMVRLIRNTADFTNTFFIAAFDQQYVINALASTGNLVKHENYLKKIFQLEVSLPPIDKKVILSTLREYLYKGMNEFTVSLFEETFAKDSEPEPNLINLLEVGHDSEFDEAVMREPYTARVYITNYLDNIREVKRFVNSFRITYSIIGNEVDLYDLLTLELIKYRLPALYNQLSTKNLLTNIYGGRPRWILNDERFESFFEQPDIKLLSGLHKQKDLFKQAINTLFDMSRIRTSRSVYYQDAFHIYFHYQLFDSISIHDFEQARTSGIESLKTYFQKIAKEERLNELIGYIERITAYKSKEDFENMLNCMFMIVSDNDVNIELVSQVLSENEKNIELYFQGNKPQYENFILSLLNNKEYAPITRAQVANFFLVPHIRRESKVFFDENSLKNILLEILNFAILSDPGNSNDIFYIYRLNWDSKNYQSNIISISNAANQSMKTYLESHPSFLSKRLFQQSDYFSTDWIEINPFIIQIFGDYLKFEHYLKSLPETKCKDFLLDTFRKIKMNEYRPIEIPDFSSNSPC